MPWNTPIIVNPGPSTPSLSEGNLRAQVNVTSVPGGEDLSVYVFHGSTARPTSGGGRWYWELAITHIGSNFLGTVKGLGVSLSASPSTLVGIGFQNQGADPFFVVPGDTLGVLLNIEASTLTVERNGILLLSQPIGSSSGAGWRPAVLYQVVNNPGGPPIGLDFDVKAKFRSGFSFLESGFLAWETPSAIEEDTFWTSKVGVTESA